ncbi:mitochondrial heat shock protein Hsp10 [Entomophthora muscae]|uniref:Mitochondrial heat shock protein Hsp10 n=2 Tax=Entomophthora muscae TaxID=34485 RepID=A0ACC2T382_9FUNG|nr:mitochondrial heat shock protein Hsp10 [Entomophthora muscae]KAJ9080485.1 mitochondrial heat shock protein Hsp10 [Entomophthora muscae]
MASRIISKRIVPLLDRVLIQRVKPEEKTASGIFIPQKAQETLNHGEVIAVGPGYRNDKGELVPVSVKPGDQVILPAYGGTDVKFEKEEYLLFKDSELLAKLES